MPNRILRNWTDSMKFDGLSAPAERLFVRLLQVADDFGRYHADARLVLSGCFPLNRSLKLDDLDAWLAELDGHKLIVRYESSGRSYLALMNFRQRLSKSIPKFPTMPGEGEHWMPDDGERRENGPRAGPDLSVPGTSGNFLLEAETKAETKADNFLKVSLPEVPTKLVSTRMVKAWEEWMVYRRKLKGHCKDFPHLFTKQIEWLSGFDEPYAYEVLQQSMRNGYTGLFQLRGVNKINGTVASGIQMVVLQKELERVEKEMVRIRSSYDSHQEWDKEDRLAYIDLRSQRNDLRVKLGLPRIETKKK